jgi:hypothetical protein
MIKRQKYQHFSTSSPQHINTFSSSARTTDLTILIPESQPLEVKRINELSFNFNRLIMVDAEYQLV